MAIQSRLEFLNTAKKICIVKPDAMGDFLLCLPTIDAIRENNTEAIVYLLVSPSVYLIAKGLSSVDYVIPISLFTSQEKNISDLACCKNFLDSLVDEFDVCILLRWDCDFYWATPLVYLINAKVKLGYSVKCNQRKMELTPGYDEYLNNLNYDSNIKHEVVKNIDLIGIERIPESIYSEYLNTNFEFDQLSNDLVIKFFKDGYYAIAISASQNIKMLSVETWIDICKKLPLSIREKTLIFGGLEHHGLGERIAKQTNLINLCGVFKPLQLIHFLKKCKGILAVDSFIKHAASFHTIPIVEFSNQSKLGNPDSEYGGIRFSAYGTNTKLLKPNIPMDNCPNDMCISSHSHCINNIDFIELSNVINQLFFNSQEVVKIY